MPKKVDENGVFQTTMRMVAERGYSGATTKQIAEAAGISEVTLFRKYGSKGSLVKKAIRSTVEACDFESASDYTGDIAADLLRFLTRYQELASGSGQFFPAVFTEMPRYPELAGVEKIVMDVISRLEALLRRYKESGTLKTGRPRQAATSLLGPVIMTNMMRYFTHQSAGAPPDLREHVDRFLKGWARE